MNNYWKKDSIPVKISGAIMGCAMAYLFFVDGESFGGWTVFFISLAATIMLQTIDDQHEEIKMLRNSKDKEPEDDKQ